jgi:hypothetical protein
MYTRPLFAGGAIGYAGTNCARCRASHGGPRRTRHVTASAASCKTAVS